MTTALSGAENIIESFKAACDSYFIKPTEKGKLIGEIKSLGLFKDLNPAGSNPAKKNDQSN